MIVVGWVSIPDRKYLCPLAVVSCLLLLSGFKMHTKKIILTDLMKIESNDNDNDNDNDDLFALLAALLSSASPRSTNTEDCEDARPLSTVLPSSSLLLSLRFISLL